MSELTEDLHRWADAIDSGDPNRQIAEHFEAPILRKAATRIAQLDKRVMELTAFRNTAWAQAHYWRNEFYKKAQPAPTDEQARAKFNAWAAANLPVDITENERMWAECGWLAALQEEKK